MTGAHVHPTEAELAAAAQAKMQMAYNSPHVKVRPRMEPHHHAGGRHLHSLPGPHWHSLPLQGANLLLVQCCGHRCRQALKTVLLSMFCSLHLHVSHSWGIVVHQSRGLARQIFKHPLLNFDADSRLDCLDLALLFPTRWSAQHCVEPAKFPSYLTRGGAAKAPSWAHV